MVLNNKSTALYIYIYIYMNLHSIRNVQFHSRFNWLTLKIKTQNFKSGIINAPATHAPTTTCMVPLFLTLSSSCQKIACDNLISLWFFMNTSWLIFQHARLNFLFLATYFWVETMNDFLFWVTKLPIRFETYPRESRGHPTGHWHPTYIPFFRIPS